MSILFLNQAVRAASLVLKGAGYPARIDTPMRHALELLPQKKNLRRSPQGTHQCPVSPLRTWGDGAPTRRGRITDEGSECGSYARPPRFPVSPRLHPKMLAAFDRLNQPHIPSWLCSRVRGSLHLGGLTMPACLPDSVRNPYSRGGNVWSFRGGSLWVSGGMAPTAWEVRWDLEIHRGLKVVEGYDGVGGAETPVTIALARMVSFVLATTVSEYPTSGPSSPLRITAAPGHPPTAFIPVWHALGCGLGVSFPAQSG
ncbi:hypothetical protein R3P38DRAFT_3196070 [Favolaschia claudopus]|uniref:Uncharacterized protein n=1 Tax=Favolaschia claudopus TaxID=2862362 RepID=A0AAW0BB33_9AGAR